MMMMRDSNTDNNYYYTVEQVELLVSQSLGSGGGNNVGQQQQQQEATRLLQEWTTANNNNNNSTSCIPTLLQVLQRSRDPSTVFYALTTLERKQQLMQQVQQQGGGNGSSPIDHPWVLQLRNLLLLYNNNNNQSNSDIYAQAPYLQNKVALILANQIVLDSKWINFDHDLCNSLSVRDPTLFLKIVDTLLQELLLASTLSPEDETATDNNQLLRHSHNLEQIRRVRTILKGYDNRAGTTETVEGISSNTANGNGNGINNPTTTPLQRLFERTVTILISSLKQQQQPPPNLSLATLALQTAKTFLISFPLEALIISSSNASSSVTQQQQPLWEGLWLALHEPKGGGDVEAQQSQLQIIAALEVWQECAMQVASSSSESNIGTTNTTAASSAAHQHTPLLLRTMPLLDVVLEKLHAILPAQDGIESEYEIEVVIQAAKLIDTLGLEILSDSVGNALLRMLTIRQKQQPPQQREEDLILVRFQKVLDLFFRAFRYDDIDVSAAVLPLASRLVASADVGGAGKKKKKNEDAADNSAAAAALQQQQLYMPQLVTILYRQMQYPPDFGYDYEDEDDAEEEVYRTELCKLYVKMVRAAPELVLEFVCRAITDAGGSSVVNSHQSNNNNNGSSVVLLTLANAPTPVVEASLRLIYHYCEGMRPPPGLKVVMRNDTFCSMLVALHQSDISHHQHRQVLCWYYDVAVRYHLLFNKHPELLHPVLSALSGPRGLQHPHPRVRSRCCYLLLKLVQSTVKSLRPYVETACAGIHGLLSSASSSATTAVSPGTASNDNGESILLTPEDTLYLFETIGHLLGRTGVDENQQQLYLTQLLTPHVRSIDEVLAMSELIQRDVEHFGEILSVSIAAMAHLSKGFTNPPQIIQPILVETLRVTLRVLQALPTSEPVRNKSMVLVQRMIQCVGDQVLPFIPEYLNLLIAHCTADDVLFVCQIMNQCCIKFKAEAIPVIDAALLPFLRKCHDLVPHQDEVDAGTGLPPHLRTEQISIQKLSYTVLQHIVTHKATAVLISPSNASSLETILQTVRDGAVRIRDPTIQRTCIKFFRELVGQWWAADAVPPFPANGHEDGEVYRRGLITFTTQSFIPDMLQLILSPSFDERDAMQARVVTEFAHVLYLVKSVTPINDLYEQSVIARLSAISGRSDLIEPLRSPNTTATDIDRCLREFLKQVKREEKSATMTTT